MGDVPAAIIDPEQAARASGLRYVSDEDPGIRRLKSGRGFSYRNAQGLITEREVLARIRKLAIPPAWTDVWICSDPLGHIQATGRDAKARKQYRYHPQFREIRDSAKFDHILDFARLLPNIRAAVSEHLSLRGLPREKVLAATVRLLESTLIRVGNEEYAKNNKSYGLTTLRDPHVSIGGSELRFQFRGKSGKSWRLAMKDRRIAKVIKACQELPGQKLLQYVHENGEPREVTSGDVNAYLREITGADVTAKDFRTWAGTVLAALALDEFEEFDSEAAGKRNIRTAIEKVSARLGNTPTICRKCYIHPEILNSYLDRSLRGEVSEEIRRELSQDQDLKPEEAAVLALLGRRIASDAKRSAAR